MVARCVLLIALMAYSVRAADLFEARVRPVLASRCQACHNATQRMGAVDLATGAALPDPARFLAAIGYEGKVKMPPAGRLPAEEMDALRQWASQGLPWPKAAVPKQDARPWWLTPVRAAEPPGQGNPIDRFLAVELAKRGLEFTPPASRLALIRRVTFDLTGLPPTETEIQAFEEDHSPQAFARVVDRLLASPRYGEKWGRHWLDAARFADSTGADEDHRYPHAWRYRDYVIDAFNNGTPYDRFIREQIAGDLMPPVDGAEINPRGIIATGFLALGPKLIAEQDKTKMFYDIVDEQIDVTGRVFLGLTIACARCHDHKFDPISTRDYYSLASIFASTRQLAKLEGTVSQLYFAPLAGRAATAAWEGHRKRVEEKQKEIDKIAAEETTRYRESLYPRLADYMLAAFDVYHNGFTAADAALRRSLDAKVVERWATYLKPTRERRPQLEAFYHNGRKDEAAAEYQRQFEDHRAARARDKERKFLAGENRFYSEVLNGPFSIPAAERQRVFSSSGWARYAAGTAELEALKKSAPPDPPLACAVAEGDPVSQHVFIRGNPQAHGAAVEKRLPVILAGAEQTAITQGSGRRELADFIASAGNPLTARVMVNRIWQWHFGEGIVRTPSNFGKLGEPPTHPELLDYLAARFVGSGWSIKAMHRLILLSRAYQQSSAAPAAAVDRDPENRWLGRFPRRRLQVEEIRDSLLAMDGSLDLTTGGTLMSGSGTDKEFAEDRKSFNPDASRRRLVYLPLRRSNLPSLLNLFDFGDATTTGEGRTQTNVAPQALFLMNSPFVEQRASTFAGRLEGAPPERVAKAYWRILNRPARPGEIDAALAYLAGYPGHSEKLAWTSFLRTLMASNEFMYVQ